MSPKRKNRNRNGKTQVSCPICDAQAIVAEVPKDVAHMLNTEPGMKYVCSGKFIFRSNTQDIQFQQCYGMPVEASIKMLQLIDQRTGKHAFSKDEVLDVYNNVASKNPMYMSSLFKYDKFFLNMSNYWRPEPVVDHVDVAKPVEPDFDAKSFMSEEDEE
jgi:hypothetical protein